MSDELIVETKAGRIRGKERRGIATWRGISYATAPRFRPPVPIEPWTGVRDAVEFGPFAMQARDPRSAMMSGVTDKTAMSEDCLVLNVYAPLAASTDGVKRPVVVWIHGGAFIMGAGSQPLYDGTSFAATHDVVVVTINYRLGVLGLMYLGDLLGDEYREGNVALLDQCAALAWVRDNIDAFGGDPSSVTVMGESAGSVSVAHLLAMPAARGLFHRAILQSGALGLIARTREDATTFAREVATWLAVEPRELPGIPVERLIAAQAHVSATYGLGAFSPHVDGVTIPQPPLELVRAGASAGVPLVIGSNRDEWMLFDTFLGSASTQLIANQLRERMPGVDKLHERYRAARAEMTAAAAAGTNVEARAGLDMRTVDARAWVDLIGDMAFRIPAIQLATAHQGHGPVWMYRFDWGTPMLGAAHALELPFVWNVIDGPFAQLLLGGDVASARPLATAMHAAWAAFIRHGAPDLTGLGIDVTKAEATPVWPMYDVHRRATFIFDRQSHVVDDPGGELRVLWGAAST